LSCPVFAQQPAASKFAPVETPAIDPAFLKTPQAAPASDGNKFKIERTDQAVPAVKIPKSIDLGTSHLELDARRAKDVGASGITPDSGETSNLSKIAPGQKQDSALPNYFGLKLSTPTR
jgi:hypothetical protein